MKYPLFIVFLFLSLGCAISKKSFEPKYLNAIKQIPIGANQTAVTKYLGEPSLRENEDEELKLTYLIPYKGIQIPKVIVWLDKDGKVTNKHINLFIESNDDMTINEIEKKIGKLNLTLRHEDKADQRHFISSVQTMDDKTAGVSLTISKEPSQNVQSISWSTPNDSHLRSARGE